MDSKTISLWALVGSILAGSQTGLGQTVTKSANIENWGASYINYVNGPNLKDGKEGSLNHYFVLKREINDDWAVSGVGRVDNFWGGEADEEAVKVGDHFIKVDYPTLYEADSNKVYGHVRLYSGSSEAAQDDNVSFRLQPRIYATTSLGVYDFGYIFIPQYNSYSVEQDSQTVAYQGHYFSVAYNLSRDVALDFAAYPRWDYQRDGSRTFNDTPVYPGVTGKVTEALTVSGYFEVMAMKPERETSTINAKISYTMF